MTILQANQGLAEDIDLFFSDDDFVTFALDASLEDKRRFSDAYYAHVEDAMSIKEQMAEYAEKRSFALKRRREHKDKVLRAKRLAAVSEQPVVHELFVFELPLMAFSPVEKKEHVGKPGTPWFVKTAVRRALRYARGLLGRAKGPKIKPVHQGGKKAEAKACGEKPQKRKAPSCPPEKPTSSERRLERDKLQARLRNEWMAFKHKLRPKLEREAEIKAKRDKRSVVLQSGDNTKLFLAGALGAVTAVAAYRTYTTVSQTSAQAARIFERVDKATDTVGAIYARLESFAEGFKRNLGPVLATVPVVLAVHYGLHKVLGTSNFMTSIVVMALARFLGPMLWNAVSAFFPGGDVHAQAGGFGDVSKLVAVLMTFSVFGEGGRNMVGELSRRMSTMSRAGEGWDAFLTWGLQAIESCINFFRTAFGKERITLYNDARRPTYDWADKIDKVLCAESTGAEPEPAFLDHMVDLIRVGTGFKELYRNTPMARFVDDYVIKITNAMVPYQGALNARNNFRFEPSVLMMLGDPGIGKTLMATPLCAAILLHSGLLPENSSYEDVVKNVWQKGTSEYWNSYANQLALVMDDAWQSRVDPTDKENEFISLIRMVGTWSMPLNFADVTSKGKFFFGSKFIFGTTNVPGIEAEARIVLQHPEALGRRIAHGVKLLLKKEAQLSDGKLNYPHFMEELRRCSVENQGIDRFPWHLWEVCTHNYMTGVTDLTKRRPLKELLLEVSNDLRKRAVSHTTMRDFLADYVKGFTHQGGSRSPEIMPVELMEMIRRAESNMDKPTAFSRFRNWIRPDTNYAENGFREAMCDFTTDFVNNAVAWKKFLMAGLVVGTLGVAFIAMRALFRMVKELIDSFIPSRRKVTRQSNRPTKIPIGKRAPTFQAGVSNIHDLLYSNNYKLYVVESDNTPNILGQVQFLCGEMAVMPRHFTDLVKTRLEEGFITLESKMVLRNCTHPNATVSVSVNEFLSLKRETHADGDVEFVKFRGFRPHRKLISSFILESDVKSLGGVRAGLEICEIDRKGVLVGTNVRNRMGADRIEYGENFPIEGQILSRYWKYYVGTEKGHCGAPVTLNDHSLFNGRTCAGMHVAGNGYIGFANIITQEMIRKALSSLEVIEDCFEEDLKGRGVEFQACFALPFKESGSFLPMFRLARPINISPNTNYYVTKHYGAFGPYEYSPAPLWPVHKEGELVYPMENAIKPFQSEVRVFEQPWLKQASYIAFQKFNALSASDSRRMYTFEEAVCGVPTEKFRKIPRNTSPGFPYIYDVKDGKKAFFGSEEEYDLTREQCQDLRRRVEHMETMAVKGQRSAVIFTPFLKDELRSAAKVENVETRIVTGAPQDYTILVREKFGAFNASVMKHSVESGLAPGVNVYRDGYKMALALKCKGPDVFDGDFKGFDASEQPCILDFILDRINDWYDDGPENKRVRTVLWADLTASRHVGGRGNDQRFVYQYLKSLPSGHPLTTIVNSFFSLICLVSAYIVATDDYVGFWDNVSPLVYGDDNVSNVSRAVAPVYNQETVAAILKREFGMIYTPGDKSGVYKPVTTLDNITFLKRKIVLSEGKWICPLELDSFLYCIYWCKNKKEENKILSDELETALSELSLHSQELWDVYAPKIHKIMRDERFSPRTLVEREAYRALTFLRMDSWY